MAGCLFCTVFQPLGLGLSPEVAPAPCWRSPAWRLLFGVTCLSFASAWSMPHLNFVPSAFLFPIHPPPVVAFDGIIWLILSALPPPPPPPPLHEQKSLKVRKGFWFPPLIPAPFLFTSCCLASLLPFSLGGSLKRGALGGEGEVSMLSHLALSLTGCRVGCEVWDLTR